jgi:hypothetical protein
MTDYPEIPARIASDVKDATLTVHREDGLYRHLEFTAQKGWTRIILVTWPYNLLVAGSHGSYHFERHGPDTEDMFCWLRRLRVDADSWSSKLVNGHRSVQEYDRDRLVRQIKQRVAEAVRDGWAPPGLRAAVRKKILDSHLLDNEGTALQLVSEFEHGTKYRAECSCGKGEDHDDYSSAVCWNALTHKGNGDAHKVKIHRTAGFDFDDFTEWHIHKLSYHFVYQCHAAVWGIAQYDAAQKAVAA